MTLPLAGRRVLVTRAAHQAGKLSDGLRALGAEPVEVPVLEIRPPEDLGPLDGALRQLGRYGWMIFTSANTVRAVTERAMLLGVKPADSGAKIAAVGEATANALRKTGLEVDVVPQTYVAESLLEALPKDLARQRILLARAEAARDVIPGGLRATGAIVDVVDAYRNALPNDAPARLAEALQQPVDAVTFTSSSSATHLAEAAALAKIGFPFAGVAAVSIGPITSQTLRELGWNPAAEADPSDIPGLLAALARLFRRPN